MGGVVVSVFDEVSWENDNVVGLKYFRLELIPSRASSIQFLCMQSAVIIITKQFLGSRLFNVVGSFCHTQKSSTRMSFLVISIYFPFFQIAVIGFITHCFRMHCRVSYISYHQRHHRQFSLRCQFSARKTKLDLLSSRFSPLPFHWFSSVDADKYTVTKCV